MINLQHDTADSFSEYKSAVDRKSESLEKQQLKSIETEMRDCFIKYQQNFTKNNLEYTTPSKIGQQYKDVLLNLYGSDASIIRRFRQRYFAQNLQTYNNLCPNCTLSEANTTEHILPKNKYPEYAVDTLNLIPACSNCNSLKGENVIDATSNQKYAINFYTDILPQEQYLYVDFVVVENNIRPTYRLDNSNRKIASNIFSLITRHFKKFDLLNRFNIKAVQEISELRNLYLVESFANDTEYDIFTSKQIKKINMDRPLLGFNHWKVILYYSAATSEVFKKYILSQ